MAQQKKSPKAIVKELRKKADKFDECVIEKALLKGNLTASTKALCHFGKLYFDLSLVLQDEDDVNTAGINSKHLETLRKHCSNIPDVIENSEEEQSEIDNNDDPDVIGDVQDTQHQDL